jgi:hypothetical protein
MTVAIAWMPNAIWVTGPHAQAALGAIKRAQVVTAKATIMGLRATGPIASKHFSPPATDLNAHAADGAK